MQDWGPTLYDHCYLNQFHRGPHFKCDQIRVLKTLAYELRVVHSPSFTTLLRAMTWTALFNIVSVLSHHVTPPFPLVVLGSFACMATGAVFHYTQRDDIGSSTAKMKGISLNWVLSSPTSELIYLIRFLFVIIDFKAQTYMIYIYIYIVFHSSGTRIAHSLVLMSIATREICKHLSYGQASAASLGSENSSLQGTSDLQEQLRTSTNML